MLGSAHPTSARVLLLTAAAVAVSLTLPACGRGASAAATPASAGPKPVPVTVAPVLAKDNLQRSVHAVGSLAPLERTVISNRVAGNVVKLYVDLGDRVQPGQKLAEIETDRFQLQVKQSEQVLAENLAKLGLKTLPTDANFNVDETSPVKKALSELEAAKIKFGRAETLYKAQLMKDFEFLDLQAALRVGETALQAARDNSRANLEAARQAKTTMELRATDLRDATILAPDGNLPTGKKVDSYAVAERKASAGEYLKDGSPMFTLVADHILKLQARLPERHLDVVRTGQTVTFKVEAYPKRTFTGTITAIDPTVDVANRTFMIEATVGNKDNLLRPGSFVQADVLTTTDRVVMVPVEAITSFAGVTKLFVLDADGKKVRQVNIDPAQQEGQFVEIPKGVSATDKVVVTGQTKLVDGSLVEVRQKPATTQTAAVEPK